MRSIQLVVICDPEYAETVARSHGVDARFIKLHRGDCLLLASMDQYEAIYYWWTSGGSLRMTM